MPFLTIPEEEAAIRMQDLILESGITALLGYGVVFLGLILLMLTVLTLSKLLAKKPEKKEQPVIKTATLPAAPQSTAPGTAGEVKLNNVDPKTAAMLMAIVADKMQKPINELRFISIKEVE